MIALIAKREVTLQFRDGRLQLAMGILVAAMAAAAINGWVQFSRAEQERSHFVAAAREQWLNQGERHPHRAAHFGTYVTKPESSLSFFEPGLRPFAGQTLWLEAHDRPAFANVPAEDDLTLGLGPAPMSGSTLLQMLGGLLALCIGALAIAGERDSGVLRQVLAQGIRPREWLAGKLIGSAAIVAIPLIAAGVVIVGGAVWAAPAMERVDIALRAVLLLCGNALLLGALLATGVAISAVASSSRAALTSALAVWIGMFVLAPRAASALSEGLMPAPTLQEYRAAAGRVFNEGFDARGGYEVQLRALEQSTMRQYGVTRLADIPVGFSGIRMKHMDAWSSEVDDREFSRLVGIYNDQSALRLTLSVVAPSIAARSFSQGMAGMDWHHYRHFLDAAETYRRQFGGQMNHLIETRVTGERWEMDGSNADWASVTPLQYESPHAGWAVSQQAGALAILVLWATIIGSACLLFAGRRLNP